MNGIFILLTIVLYFGLLLWVSRWAGKRHSDNDAFFRGNRESPWYIVSFGMIGASLSGVTFVSVPGMVQTIDMTYMQTCMGFFCGYLIIAHVLLPLYYRLNLTSIYTYLGKRLGRYSYKTGASFFLLSKTLGAAARLYLVCVILQHFVFDAYHIPFAVTAIGTVALIWLYTRKSGIRSIVWTDSLQTFCLLLALGLILYQTATLVSPDFKGVWNAIQESGHSRIFVFDDWQSKQNFFKQFFSGIFITIVMTGLDQDMMQKNLSCRNLKEAQKNMYCYGLSFVPVTVLVLFTIGIIAAAFSSADSALAALTTSFCIDILNIERYPEQRAQRIRKGSHLLIATVFVLCILAFETIGSPSVIDTIYTLASYTYGPLLGLFCFGLFTRMRPRDKGVPYIALASPVVCYLTDRAVFLATGYRFGYEMLMLNGLLTFGGLALLSIGRNRTTHDV